MVVLPLVKMQMVQMVLPGGPDIGGVRAPLLNLQESDKAIAQECVEMINAAKAKL